jgi:hypothetical protein
MSASTSVELSAAVLRPERVGRAIAPRRLRTAVIVLLIAAACLLVVAALTGDPMSDAAVVAAGS